MDDLWELARQDVCHLKLCMFIKYFLYSLLWWCSLSACLPYSTLEV